MSAKKIKEIEKDNEPEEKKVLKATEVVNEKDIVMGSFTIEGNILKLVAFSAKGERLEMKLPIDKPTVDILLS